MTAPFVFGIDLTPITTRLATLEAYMASAAEQLTALSAKVDDVINDVRAGLAILTAGQAALDELSAKVDAFDVEIGDADGSDTPPE